MAQANENKRASYLASWRDDIDSGALYRALSEVEDNPELGRVYARLAEVEEHASFWEEKLKEARGEVPPRSVGWRSRMLTMLARRFGPQLVVPTIERLS